MIDINKLALEAYPEKLVTVGDNLELWDENEQYRECWIEGYNKALIINNVVGRSEQLVCPDCKGKYISYKLEEYYECSCGHTWAN